MVKSKSQSISAHFANLSDPRRDNKRHQLQDTLPLGRLSDTFGIIWGGISPEFVDQLHF